MILEENTSLKKRLKESLCGNDYFKRLDFNVNKNHNPYDNIIGFASNGTDDFVIGPEECTKNEIVTLLSKSLDLDAIEFENVDIMLSCMIREIGKYHINNDSEQNTDNPYDEVIRVVRRMFITSEGENIERMNGKNLNPTPMIASARAIYLYENNENREISYDMKRMATISLSYYYSMMIGDSLNEWRIAVFPAYLIFELFVYKTACEIFSNKQVRYQETRDYLKSTPYGDIKIRPDVLIKDNEGMDKLILDAKYKRLSRNRCYSDVHQMSTYIGCLKRADGILIYPSFLNREKRSFVKDKNEMMGFLMLDVINYKESYETLKWTLQNIDFRHMKSGTKKILFVLLINSGRLTETAVKSEIDCLCAYYGMNSLSGGNYRKSKHDLLIAKHIEQIDDVISISDWPYAIKACTKK